MKVNKNKKLKLKREEIVGGDEALAQKGLHAAMQTPAPTTPFFTLKIF